MIKGEGGGDELKGERGGRWVVLNRGKSSYLATAEDEDRGGRWSHAS